MTSLQGAAALTGPPLAGAVVDLLGDRGIALDLAGGIMCVAALLYMVSFLSIRRQERKLRRTLLTKSSVIESISGLTRRVNPD